MSDVRGDDPRTPRMSPEPIEEYPSTPKSSTSPTTSTPGSSPTSLQHNGLKDSELLSSEESIVNSSTTKEGSSTANLSATEEGREMGTRYGVKVDTSTTEEGRERGTVCENLINLEEVCNRKKVEEVDSKGKGGSEDGDTEVVLMVSLSGNSDVPEGDTREKKEEVETDEVTLTGKSGDWDSTLNVDDTLVDTTMEYDDQEEPGPFPVWHKGQDLILRT